MNGARDFHTGNRLTADFPSDPEHKVEDHHIFATAYLKKLGRPAETSILNRCLIDNITNQDHLRQSTLHLPSRGREAAGGGTTRGRARQSSHPDCWSRFADQ